MAIDNDISKEYVFEDFIGVAGRENNSKRQFLFVNRRQGKYVPSKPEETIEMFHCLGSLIRDKVKGENTAVIGFAETATALGAFASEMLGSETYYLHTTRRFTEEVEEIIAFEEEHSHATSHKLYCSDSKKLKECDSLVFIDDEFTTGKTICNLVDALTEAGQLGSHIKLFAASVLNCMSDDDMEGFKRRGIESICILKKDKLPNEKIPGLDKPTDGIRSKKDSNSNEKTECSAVNLPGRQESAYGVTIGEYRRESEKFAKSVIERIIPKNYNGSILVLGTEEFMYPPIVVANQLKIHCPNTEVRVQATGRSPILTGQIGSYPIKSREKIGSIYDNTREVHLYNIEKYDKVLVITDSSEAVFFGPTEEALRKYGNEDVTLVQWEV